MRPIWVKTLPENWSSVPFGSIFSQSNLKNKNLNRNFVLSLIKDKGVLPYADRGNTGNKVSEDLSGYKLVDKGDFVLNSMNLYMGSVGVSNFDGITSSAYIICKPSTKIVSNYYKYFIQFRGFQEYVGLLGRGIMEIREAVRWTALKSVIVPLPKVKIQHEISNFLDKETARIDLLIEKKQQMIELLKEKRLANISSVIYMNGKSNRLRLRNVALVLSSNVDKITKDEEHSVRLCNYVDVYKNDFINKNMHFTSGSAKLAEVKKFRLKPNDVVITKDSESIDDIGVPSLVKSSDNDLVCGYHLSILRPITTRIKGSFLFWHLMSQQSRADFGNNANGVTRFGLTLNGIKNIEIQLPNLEIQKEISDYLNKEYIINGKIINNLNLSIKLYREYRTALISAVVTGQIDVKSYGKSGTVHRQLHYLQPETEI